MFRTDNAVQQEDNYWRYVQNQYEFTYDEQLTSAMSEEESKKRLEQLLQSPTPRNILKIEYRRNKFWIDESSKLKDRGITPLIEAIEAALEE